SCINSLFRASALPRELWKVEECRARRLAAISVYLRSKLNGTRRSLLLERSFSNFTVSPVLYPLDDVFEGIPAFLGIARAFREPVVNAFSYYRVDFAREVPTETFRLKS